MKKILGIVVLCLFLSGNAYAATKITYLSCKQIIKSNDSEGTFSADNTPLKVGAYNGHFFFKFKDVKKKSTVTIYEQGDLVSVNWKEKKPKKTYQVKFDYEDSIYSYGESGGGLTLGYAIENSNGNYLQTTILKSKDHGLDLAMDTKCEKVNKKKFKSLIKNGVN
jgi:hypothetical protein